MILAERYLEKKCLRVVLGVDNIDNWEIALLPNYMDHAFCARAGGVYLWVEYCGFQREQEYKEEWSVVHKEDQKF